MNRSKCEQCVGVESVLRCCLFLVMIWLSSNVPDGLRDNGLRSSIFSLKLKAFECQLAEPPGTR